ncbi:probable ATP-dependent RNA helicase DDX10 [Littorina saxatilis]|uniref:ATP-dependent RNA helicase n=1 Tax=Littorina saxatilis TaxID=31220 RepID=A0AAN9GHB8_9CAEN
MKPTNGKRFGQAFSFKKKKLGKGLQKGNRQKKVVLTKSQIVDNEIADLQRRIDEGIDANQIETFSDFPLSRNTLAGLAKARFSKPTDIQKQAVCAALQARDVLGAAKTGSGKTLAFLIPVLEALYKAKTSPTFGMAALIITPTRELAFQIFEVLNKIRTAHDFSANLIIGGKHMWREVGLMNSTNIVICTPGRLLHHLDQTRMFNADELKILVLDEADRIMDSKFAKDMDNIIGHLPAERQTLLFSATQTKSVKALARLSLKDPAYVSVHEHEQYSTPSGLKQSYLVCELQHKLSFLYSFLKSHPNNKILVFLHTCKQVRFVHTIMKRERPGMTVLHLHGGLNQLRRIEVYREFCQKQHVILIATDVACRGLDFPNVNWVVQLDCPTDAATYIHRAGRTARFERNGQALLVLLPSEEENMVQELRARKIPIENIRVNNRFQYDITGSTAAACAENKELKDMAERAYRSYIFSISTMKNKKVFDVSKIDLEEFAKSLGLFLPPRLRFLEKQQKAKAEKAQKQKSADNGQKAKPPTDDTSDNDEDDDDSSDGSSDDSSSESDGSSDESDDDDSDESDDDDSEESSSAMRDSGKKKSQKRVKVKPEEKPSKAGSDDSDDNDDDDTDDDDDEEESSHGDGVKEAVTNPKSKPVFNLGDDSDDDAEDLFTVKRTLMPLRVEEDGEMADIAADTTEGSKRTTKAAVVKRMKKKGIMANTRLTFDDEGNVVVDALKRRMMGDVSEGEDSDGGINIGSAAKRLRLEDSVDKVLERQRIKQKHREERIKKKEKKRAEQAQQRRAGDDGEEDALLGGVDDDDDPFKYIPDPDKLASLGSEESGSGDDENADDSGDNGDDDSGDDGDDASSSDEDDEEVVPGNRSSLEDAALQLLQMNRKKKT